MRKVMKKSSVNNTNPRDGQRAFSGLSGSTTSIIYVRGETLHLPCLTASSGHRDTKKASN